MKLPTLLALGAVLLNSQAVRAQGGAAPSKPATKTSIFCLHGCGSSRVKDIPIDNKTQKGEKFAGPLTIKATHLNPLRYSYKWQSDVTYTAAPDLWSKLTNIGTPQPASKEATAPTSKTTAPQANLPGSAARAELKVRGLKAVVKPKEPAISPETAALLDKVDKLTIAAKVASDKANDAITGIDDGLKTQITTDFGEVTKQVVSANASTTAVGLAGADLLVLLRGVTWSSTSSDVDKYLSAAPEYKFVAGVSAQWPDSQAIATLQRSADDRKASLNSKKGGFDTASPALLADLIVSQRDLETTLGDLNSQSRKIPTDKPTEAQDLKDATDSVQTRLGEVRQAQIDLRDASEMLTWAITQNNSMETALANLDTSGDKYKSFQAAQAKVLEWHHRMIQLKQEIEDYRNDPDHRQDPFSTTFAAGCDYTFSTTKQNAIKLTQIDELPDKSAIAPADVLSVTIECASPFTVSAGVEFSGIPTREFAIHPVAKPAGSTTTVNEFVLTSQSHVHPLPIGMVSARFSEVSENVSFHVSLGISGNFNSQNSGGSSAEFLIGPSIAIFRTMFLTPGLHIGKKSALGDGFVVGNPAPANVTSPPLSTAYTTGFGFAITFTKP
jgi:hypothetical protein